jgi:hypothetical protein
MTRKGERRRDRSGPPKPSGSLGRENLGRPAGRRRPRRRWWWLPALGAVAAVAVLLFWRIRPRAPEPPPPAAGPWERLTPREAYNAGVEMMNKGQNLESLPYLRHAHAGSRGQFWDVSFAISFALRNASFASREQFGQTTTATRSSVERVQLTREALFYLTQAERAATRPRDIAEIRKQRADALSLWGCAWDAFANYRDAQAADSSWDEPARWGDVLMRQMEHPAAEGGSRP